MEDRPGKTESRKASRRQYSAAFKASVVEECSQTGVSKAEIARKYGIHTSVVYRWVRVMRQTEPVRESLSTSEVPPTTASVASAQAVGSAPEEGAEQTMAPAGLPRGFIPIATAAPSGEVIHIQVHSEVAQVHIRWPSSAAAQCVQWMRDGLGAVLQPQQIKGAAQELRPDKPPPDVSAFAAETPGYENSSECVPLRTKTTKPLLPESSSV